MLNILEEKKCQTESVVKETATENLNTNIIDNNLWLDIQNFIKDDFKTNGEIDSYDLYISKLKLVSITKDTLILSVECEETKEYINNKFFKNDIKKLEDGTRVYARKGLKQKIKERFNISHTELILDSNQENVVSSSKYKNLWSIGVKLNELFTFDNYVVGDSNKLAFSTVKSVVDNYDSKDAAKTNIINNFNPIFLYSDVGLGKTHLIQAMAWSLKEKYKNKNIIYISAEKYMQLFIQSLQNKEGASFNEKFRYIDILLVDDIQFIIGKEQTQKQFFNTFNILVNEGKKIVIACNRSPDKLDVDEQLKSKMKSGIVIDIANPDYEMRYNIAKKKAEVFGLKCDDEIYKHIATMVKTTSRDVEGIIKRLLVYQTYEGTNITIDTVNNLLKDCILNNKKIMTVEKIQNAVCDYFKISIDNLLSIKKNKSFSFPRQIAFYLSRQLTGDTFVEIGNKFKKNHATVMVACDKTEKELNEESDKSKELLSVINDIKNKLRY